jgi:hypothetical protein
VAIVAQFLRGRGAGEATVASLRAATEHQKPRTGIRHVRIEQEAAGLRILDAHLKAALDSQGRLVHVIARGSRTCATASSPRWRGQPAP